MPFAKGHQKFGGKRNGCKNKITKDLEALLNDLGCNPIEGLARIAENEKVEVAVRVRAYSEVCKYVHPQLQRVDVKHGGNGPAGEITLGAADSAVEALISGINSIAARLGADADPKDVQ